MLTIYLCLVFIARSICWFGDFFFVFFLNADWDFRIFLFIHCSARTFEVSANNKNFSNEWIIEVQMTWKRHWSVLSEWWIYYDDNDDDDDDDDVTLRSMNRGVWFFFRNLLIRLKKREEETKTFLSQIIIMKKIWIFTIN